MTITNAEIINALKELINTLENEGENPYKIRAYRKAMNAISNLNIEITDMIKAQQELTSIPFIGSKIASLIKKVIIEDNLNIIINKHKEPRTSLSILPAKPYVYKRTYRLHHVIPVVEHLLVNLKKCFSVIEVSVTGTYRRKCELHKEIAIVVMCDNIQLFQSELKSFHFLKSIHEINQSQYSLTLNADVTVNLYITSKLTFATTLLYTTGPRDHVNALEDIAKKHHLTLSVDGLYKNKQCILLPAEEDIYHQLALQYIPPELREDPTSILKARCHLLPALIRIEDIRGNLHCHTIESDGIEKLETMANEAILYHYDYLSITDHTQSLKIARGLDEKRLWKQIRQIDKLNDKLAGKITILKSSEIDILEDGRLDLSNSILKELDIRVCAIHSKFKLSEKEQTARVLKAMDNPYFNIFAHPTGRLINKRPPYPIDMEIVIKRAKESNCFLEINSQPYRLDINAEYARKAKEAGVKISISTDAHSKVGFTYMSFGIHQARRGGLEALDVINTYSLTDLLKLMRR